MGSQGPPVNPLGMKGPPETPPPRENQFFRPYMTGFSMHLNVCEQPFGMPTSMMENLHNSTSMYIDPLVNASSPLQGSGSIVNNLGRSQPLGMGFHTQMSNLTIILYQY